MKVKKYNFVNFMCEYKCDNFPNLLITGGHSLLIDNLTDKMKKFVNDNIWFNYKNDGKIALLADLDDNCEKITCGNYIVYHLVLENDGDLNKCYGIYSNGILTETMSEKFYNDMYKRK